MVDLKSKTEKFLFREGIGPDEVFNPYRIVGWKNEIYINSYYSLNYINRFSTGGDEFKLDRFHFELPIDFDDFVFISDNLLALANVNWEAGFVRFYDLKSKNFIKIGTSKITDIMLKFNVNRASLCILGDKLYATQSIKPEIQVISIKEKKFLDPLLLSPPFYKPIPERYTVKKYDDKGHRKWMAGWTSVFDIIGKDNWLLVIYRWGYDQRYCYELINLIDVDNRFFIGETSYMIYDFTVEKDYVDFEACVQQEENIAWKRAKAYFH